MINPVPMSATPPALRHARKRTKPLVIGPADNAILHVLFRYHYLTSQRICRLLYSPGSASLVRTRMKRLVDGGYCQPVFLPSRARGGSPPLVYTLARKGVQFLQEQEVAVDQRLRPSEQRELSYLFLTHTLAVNDFLIGAELLARQLPTVALHRMVHELDLKRQPVHVQLADGSKVAVIPDGWLDFRVTTPEGRFQSCLALELDRGTVDQKRWRKKVAALLAYAKGPYEATFGTDTLTIAVVATPGAPRCTDLVRWTEAELTTRGEQHEADLFRFTALPPDAAPEELLLAPHWYRPFDKNPVSLLETI